MAKDETDRDEGAAVIMSAIAIFGLNVGLYKRTLSYALNLLIQITTMKWLSLHVQLSYNYRFLRAYSAGKK